MPGSSSTSPGKYIVSDKPMTEEQWIKERAVVVDGDDAVDVTPAVTPALPVGKDKSQK